MASYRIVICTECLTHKKGLIRGIRDHFVCTCVTDVYYTKVAQVCSTVVTEVAFNFLLSLTLNIVKRCIKKRKKKNVKHTVCCRETKASCSDGAKCRFRTFSLVKGVTQTPDQLSRASGVSSGCSRCDDYVR